MEEQKKDDTIKFQKKKINVRLIVVLIFLLIYIISSYISYRGEYLEILEMGEEYLTIFYQNQKYKLISAISIFLIVFVSVYITNKFIKKGLKEFFIEENKTMPKLPNKSIAFIIAIIVSIFFSDSITEKLMLFLNTTWFGKTDLIFNLDKLSYDLFVI